MQLLGLFKLAVLFTIGVHSLESKLIFLIKVSLLAFAFLIHLTDNFLQYCHFVFKLSSPLELFEFKTMISEENSKAPRPQHSNMHTVQSQKHL